MFRVGEQVEIISDGRIGTIKSIHSHKEAANMPGAVEVIDSCSVCFGNAITIFESFKPEQLRPVE